VAARILVVSHEATRTGAPKIAIEVARSLQEAGYAVHVLLRWGGPLAHELDQHSAALTLEPLRRSRALLRRLFPHRKFVNHFEELVAWLVLLRYRPGLVYANTVKSACYVRPALRRGIPVVLHVHELEPLASGTLARYGLDDHYGEVTLVACSQAVRDHLVGVTGVPVDQIHVIRSLVDSDGVRRAATACTPVDVSTDGGETVIGACARADRRKGVDLWLDAMASVARARPDRPLRFCWVGACDDEVREAASVRGLSDRVEFVGEVENTAAHMAAFDVFTLPSREDPFPLVVLEAMALGRPVVAFAVGGVPEQVGEAGILVAPTDVDGMTAAVIGLVDDPVRRAALGRASRDRSDRVFPINGFRVSVARLVADTLKEG
jgi:glycosyltransferase involved in cell wall biosynthesis